MKNLGMEPLIRDMRVMIEEKMKEGYRRFIIFPFGDVGMKAKQFLNSVYNIREVYILDNSLFRFNWNIKPLSYMAEVEHHDCAVLLASTNLEIYQELKDNLLMYFVQKQIGELECMKRRMKQRKPLYTKIGKYSYGPICHNHDCIEEIGSFCSFARGVEVVANHEMQFITTHPLISCGRHIRDVFVEYDEYQEMEWFFAGVQPHEECTGMKRSIIGSDVWLGRNVIVTNGAKIGNGVIAGAGAVITRDVPDYAVVAGVPAHIMKFRYEPEQIDALNRIKWWEWSDRQIRERYDDFYLPVNDFIKKWG